MNFQASSLCFESLLMANIQGPIQGPRVPSSDSESDAAHLPPMTDFSLFSKSPLNTSHQLTSATRPWEKAFTWSNQS